MTIPHDIESERHLIGICILAGLEAVEEIQLQSNPLSLFHDERLRELWNRIEKLAKAKKPISISSLLKEKIEHDIERNLIVEIEADALPLSFLPTYLPQAQQFARRRAAIETARQLATRAQHKIENIDALIDEAEKELFACRFKEELDGTVKDAILEAIDDWQYNHAHKGIYTGVASGFVELDNLTWGFQKKNLIIIAARPSQGKTALLCNIAENACIKSKIPTLIFSLEMTRKELIKRMLCSLANLDGMRLRKGDLQDADLEKMTPHSVKLNSAPLTIIDRGSLTINQMRSMARRQIAKNGTKLILVDYLQKIRSTVKQEKRTYEVGEVSTGLKELSKELNVPVVCACQLNRESEKDKGRAPRLSDLGDSGMIERDADLVALLYRLPDQSHPEIHQFYLLLQKQRDGPTGKIDLNFHRAFTRFETCIKQPEQTNTPYPND